MGLKIRKNMIALQIILSGAIFMGSPFIMMGYFMGAASAVNMIGRSAFSEYASMMLLGTFLLYPVILNIYGWYMVIRHIPYSSRMFLYAFFAWIVVFAWHLSWYFRGL